MADYFVSIDGQRQEGPFAIRELLDRDLRPDSLVWREGMPDWQRADTMPELAPIFARATATATATAPPPTGPFYAGRYTPPLLNVGPMAYSGGPPPYNPSDVNSKRVAAGVCGILFGGLGIHKFILGFPGTGTIMLLSTILTCGIALAVMHVIGFIEGIIYLAKSDEDFYQTYFVERRNWF
jgi:TM2 domain-containing membrane protein YozV